MRLLLIATVVCAYAGCASVSNRPVRHQAPPAAATALPDDGAKQPQRGTAQLIPIPDAELAQADQLYALRIIQAPQDPRGYMARAMVRQKAGDLAGARVVYSQCVKAIPEFGPAWANLGALLLEDGKVDEAARVLMQGAASAPEHAGTFANLAGALSMQGRDEDALQASETAIELDAEDADLRRNHIAILYKSKKFVEAERALKRAIAEFPDDGADFMMRLSELQMARGELGKAVETLERVNKMDPHRTLAFLRRAAILGREEDLDGSLRALVEGLEQNPDDEELRSFFRVAMALRLHRDLEEGMARIQEDPTDVDAYLRVARVYELGKDYRAALAVLTDGATNNPRNGELWVHIGLLESTLEREREALAAYRRAIKMDPALHSALNNCAYLLVTAHDPTLRDAGEAMKLARKAVELEPTNTSYLDTMAEVQFVRGDVRAARNTITRALELRPADPQLLAQAQRFDEALSRQASARGR